MGFNPRSPRGGATIKFVKSSIVLILFQSTLPTRGSDFNFRSFFKPDYGFNPRSPRGGATQAVIKLTKMLAVSIHAPHEGERLSPLCPFIQFIYVSIHAPHEGERLKMYNVPINQKEVSIHAPHEGERRGGGRSHGAGARSFNPRSPRGGATIPLLDKGAAGLVSIHAPHEGERRFRQIARKHQITVSIHAPHEGERPLLPMLLK